MANKIQLSPKKILNKQFQIDFKGYSATEVDYFLDSIVEDYETFASMLNDSYDQIENLQKENEALKMKMANIALEIAISAHKGQKDLGGRDYIEHPKAVANLLETDEEKTIGYLHDVLEDTSITEEDLVTMGISSEIVSAIKVLTKKRGEPYTEYIERVKENELARKVKIADLQHNMDLSRIPNPTKRDFERLEKYKKALMYLKF